MEKKYEDVIEMIEETVGDYDCYYSDDSLADMKMKIKKVLSDMSPDCKKYYLDNRDIYNERFDIDKSVPDKLYLWVCAEFDPEYNINNI